MDAKNAAFYCDIRPSTAEQVLVTDNFTCMLDERRQNVEGSTAELYWRFTTPELSFAERKIEWSE
jgi:hypothetical protein